MGGERDNIFWAKRTKIELILLNLRLISESGGKLAKKAS